MTISIVTGIMFYCIVMLAPVSAQIFTNSVDRIVLANSLDDTTSQAEYLRHQYNLWADSKIAVRNFATDAAGIYSSPARIKRDSSVK